MARLQGRVQDWAVGVRPLGGDNAMNSVKRIFLIATAVLVLTFLPASLAHAQSHKADELNRRVIELYRAGRYAEAIPLVQQALAIYEKALGPDHPDVATAVNNLALLYDKQDRTAEAEPLYKRALAIDEKALGPDHPNVVTVLNSLAELYRDQGRYAEAEPPARAIWLTRHGRRKPRGR
jgi:tetratricopeptide (TPR) repeat protein